MSVMNSRRLMGITPKAKDHGFSIAGLEWQWHRSKKRRLISALGQKRQMQCEPTGGSFPLFPKSGNVNAHQQNTALCQKPTYAAQQIVRLLDHLVGAREQCRGRFEAKRLRRFQIDDQFVLGRCLHRQVGRLLAFEDAINVASGAAELIEKIRSVADETAYLAIETRVVDRGQSVPSGQRNDQIAMRGRRRTARDNEATVAGEEDRPRDRQVAVDLRLRSTRAETCTRLRGDTRSGDGGVR